MFATIPRKENRHFMPLLKKPLPAVPKRLYHIRIEEPLALKMEKYAEFLGSKTVDHVIREALDFVFKKDTDFKEWAEEHPASAPPKAKSNGTGQAPDTSGKNPTNVRSTM